jgi:hypothetical protein
MGFDRSSIHIFAWLLAALVTPAMAQDEIYSGPQKGEPLSGFLMRPILGVQNDTEGDLPTELDPVKNAEERPVLLVFVHEINRPVIAMTRALTRYAKTREKDGLNTAVILLTEDISNGEAMLKRVQHALAPGIVHGVSLDGREGPGALGLNRSVQMTILVAKSKTVTANFALVQPSLQADLPKIVAAIVEQVGGTIPEMSNLLDKPDNESMRPRGDKPSVDPDRMRSLMRPLIQKDATDEQVDAAAKAIEQACKEDPEIQKEVLRIAKTIVQSGKLENYGTARAQSILRRWARGPGETDGE